MGLGAQEWAGQGSAQMIVRDDPVAPVNVAVLHRENRQHVAGIFGCSDPVDQAPAKSPAETPDQLPEVSPKPEILEFDLSAPK